MIGVIPHIAAGTAGVLIKLLSFLHIPIAGQPMTIATLTSASTQTILYAINGALNVSLIPLGAMTADKAYRVLLKFAIYAPSSVGIAMATNSSQTLALAESLRKAVREVGCS